MTLSINPSYFCNFSCDFCYLTKEQLTTKTLLKLDSLDELLKQVPNIDYIDLYGGEFSTLPIDYVWNLRNIIRKHYQGEINIVTNFSVLRKEFLDKDISLSISYDFAARERHEEVYNNMLMSEKEFSILILASKEVIEMDVSQMVEELNILGNLTSVEIKPYSINQANQHTVTHRNYEDFVRKWLNKEKKFTFINEIKIQESKDKVYDAFSNNHVYITPGGKFAVLEFDEEDKEYFLELDSFKEYKDWSNKEPEKLSPICLSCEYVGHCLTEHYRYVKDLDNSCSGYIGLLNG